MSLTGDPRTVARQAVAAAFRRPPSLDLNQWAVRNVVFGAESPFPGPYDPDRFPFFRRILEVLAPEHPATIVVLRKSAQLGGTILAQIFALGILDQAPQPILYVHPIDSNAKRWKRNKLSKMVKASPGLAAVMQPDGARTGNSAMYWARRDGRGFLQLAGANSPSQLSMDSFPIAVHDDMAKWTGDNGAGDPETQADSRSKAFLISGGKILKIGTPAIEPGCRMSANWRQGTRERWHVPCPHCGQEQALEWANMLAALDEAIPEDAHFTCIGCAERIEERHRDWMNRRGRWVAENPKAAIISFDLWAACSPLESWANIATAWLRAKGNPDAERTFLNDSVGQPQQTATAAPDWSGLKDRAEAEGLPRSVVPAGYFAVTVGVDCQIDRLEWVAVAWGPRLRRIVIDRGIIRHHIGEQAAHDELQALLDRTWSDSRGLRRPVDCLAIDAGNWGNDVLGFLRRAKSSRAIAVKGSRFDNAPPLARVKFERRPDGQVLKSSKQWFHVGVSGLKASLYSSLPKLDPMEMGFVGFVSGMEDQYYQELTSEVRKPVKRRDGSTEWRWMPLTGVAQEGLDCTIYATAGAIRWGWQSKSDEQWLALQERWEPASLETDAPLLAALHSDETGARRAPKVTTIRSAFLDR